MIFYPYYSLQFSYFVYYSIRLLYSLPNKVIVFTITSVSNSKHFHIPSLKALESLFEVSGMKKLLRSTIQPYLLVLLPPSIGIRAWPLGLSFLTAAEVEDLEKWHNRLITLLKNTPSIILHISMGNIIPTGRIE